MEPATQIRPPEDPPVCPGRLSLSPWLQAGLAVFFFFFLIEQIFIEHLLQAVPTLLPPWPLKQANSSSKSHLSEKAPLTLSHPLHPQAGQGVPLSLSVPPSIMVGS